MRIADELQNEWAGRTLPLHNSLSVKIVVDLIERFVHRDGSMQCAAWPGMAGPGKASQGAARHGELNGSANAPHQPTTIGKTSKMKINIRITDRPQQPRPIHKPTKLIRPRKGRGSYNRRAA